MGTQGVKESFITLMVIFMKETGKMTCTMAKEKKNGKMGQYILANIIKELERDKENIFGTFFKNQFCIIKSK